jgi:hypothetical protein
MKSGQRGSAGRPAALHGPVATLPKPGVHPLVDLVADPLDQALSNRAVVVAAKFAVRCRRGGDVFLGKPIHGEKIHLDYRKRP